MQCLSSVYKYISLKNTIYYFLFTTLLQNVLFGTDA